MIAPIDARASFEAEGETLTLQMNFRTIALAEDAKPDVVNSFSRGGKPTLSGVAALIWAFAQPAHPELSQDQALALVMRHGEAAGAALAEVFRAGTATAGGEPADGTARPRKSRSAS